MDLPRLGPVREVSDFTPRLLEFPHFTAGCLRNTTGDGDRRSVLFLVNLYVRKTTAVTSQPQGRSRRSLSQGGHFGAQIGEQHLESRWPHPALEKAVHSYCVPRRGQAQGDIYLHGEPLSRVEDVLSLRVTQ